MHRDVTDGPYQIAVNAEPIYRSTDASIIDGYRVSAIIKRADGNPVVDNFITYNIPQRGAYLNLKSALDDGERMAKLAITDGFAD